MCSAKLDSIYFFSSKTMAKLTIPCSFPTNPKPFWVVALTETLFRPTFKVPAIFFLILPGGGAHDRFRHPVPRARAAIRGLGSPLMPKRVPETGVRGLAVEPGGLAERAGLRPGDRLLRVNGQGLRDLVDFHVQAGEEELAIDVDRGGRPCSVVLGRKWGRDLGLECEPPAPAEISTCANKCVFCFIHQLPPGLRKSLYVKDDDYRLSFLHGNYITLTDLPDSEIQRIVDLRLSPLYISVHATAPV